MNRDEYRAYLRSAYWRDFREAMLWEAGFRCQDCGSFARLDVHHLHYRTLGAEGPDDVRVLCRPCHRKAHGLAGDAMARLVARLAAAFPFPRQPDETLRLYAEKLAALLADEQTAAEAVEAVIVDADRWPSLQRLLDEYAIAARRRARRLAEARGLPEPSPMPRAEQLERARQYRERIGRPIDPPPAHSDAEFAAELATTSDERDRRRADEGDA